MTGRLKPTDKVHYLGQTTFTIGRQFTDLKIIGKGSYGVVCSALDSSQEKKVAIKKVTPITRDIQDAKHVLREIRLMRHMGKHENIISLYDLYVRESADELYIVMELLDSDLHKVLQSPQKLTNGHFRHFLFQLLCGVKYLHDNRIIHRDLKPGNLLVSRDCKLRITDFGLARERPVGNNQQNDPDDEIDEPMTEHVVTRWYRPPELMLCPDGLYTYAIDMWSCGCIFGEMLARRPLFPGKNFIDQLTLIFNFIGSPSSRDTKHIENIQAKKFLESQRGKSRVVCQSVFPEFPPEAIQILETLLIFKPSDRLTCDETLLLPYFDKMPSSSSMLFPKTSPLFEFKFESEKNPSKRYLKQLISAEVMSLKRENSKRSSSNISNGTGGGSSKEKPRSASATAAPGRNEESQKKAREYASTTTTTSSHVDDEDDTKSKASVHSTGSKTVNNQNHTKKVNPSYRYNTATTTTATARATSTGRTGMHRATSNTTTTDITSETDTDTSKPLRAKSTSTTARRTSQANNSTASSRFNPQTNNASTRQQRKAPIVPQAQPPYKKLASQRPAVMPEPVPNRHTTTFTADPDTHSDVNTRQRTVNTTSNTTAPHKKNILEHQRNTYVEDSDEPEAESKEIDGTTENFGLPAKPVLEDFSAARAFLQTPVGVERAHARPISGVNVSTKTRPVVGSEFKADFSDKDKDCDSEDDDGYASPSQSNNRNSSGEKSPAVLLSPSRMNKAACNILSDEKYSSRAMELLQNNAAATTIKNNVGVGVGSSEKYSQKYKTIDSDNNTDNDSDRDAIENISDDDDEDIVAKMYRLYGQKSTSAGATTTVNSRIRPTSAAVVRPEIHNETTQSHHSKNVGVRSGGNAFSYSHNVLQESEEEEELDDTSDVDDESDNDSGPIDPPSSQKLHSRPLSRTTHLSSPARPSSVAQAKSSNTSVNSTAAKETGYAQRRYTQCKDEPRYMQRTVERVRNADQDNGRDTENVKERDTHRDKDKVVNKSNTHAAPKKKQSNLTVPQSPQFSKMSWQRNREAKNDRDGNYHLNHTASRPRFPDRHQEETRKTRASSAPRVRPREKTVNGQDISGDRYKPAVPRSNVYDHLYSHAQAKRSMGRSASSGRMRTQRI